MIFFVLLSIIWVCLELSTKKLRTSFNHKSTNLLMEVAIELSLMALIISNWKKNRFVSIALCEFLLVHLWQLYTCSRQGRLQNLATFFLQYIVVIKSWNTDRLTSILLLLFGLSHLLSFIYGKNFVGAVC